MRAVARRFGVGLGTVQRWVTRAGDRALDDVDWSDRSSAPVHRPRRIPTDIEDGILDLRRSLREESVLGEYGAAAIRRELLARDGAVGTAPSVRTIGRILDRRGALDARRRVRRHAPPPGWYLPDLACRQVELDAFDVIDGLRFRGGRHLQVLTGMSLHGGLPGAWPAQVVTTALTMAALEGHWREHGLPAYAQFDNDTRFQGSHGYVDLVGRLIRLLLGLGVVPVFAPPREPGFQAAIESFNGRWQAKVWNRFWSPEPADLDRRSAGYIAACRARAAARIEAAPPRSPFPADWESDPAVAPEGRMIFVRRTSERGEVEILGRRFAVDRHWAHRLVRAEADLTVGRLRCYALRRREPSDQPLLCELPYELRRHRIYRS